MKKYDLVIIGGGVGLYLAEAAMQNGLSCALIEYGKMGGTCLTRGCIPSKVLVHVADLYREIQHAAKTGLFAKVENMDWSLISKRVWAKIDQSKQIESEYGKLEKLDLYKGTASFSDQDTVQIRLADSGNIESVRGEKIVIAAGGRSFVPPIEGLELAGYLTAETFFGEKYPEKPWSSLTILGGGAIGLEFAHIFSALGTRVTLLEMQDRLASTEEPEISRLLAEQLEAAGVRVLTGFKARFAYQDSSGKKIVAHDQSGRDIEVVSEEILLASGIRSNSDLLSLENTDIRTDEKGWIITDEYLATSQKNVWAIGDINGKYQFRHKANYEAEVLAHNLFGDSGSKRQVRYDFVPWAIFTYPQIAHVGMTEAEALAAGYRVMAGINSYSAVANGYALGYEEGDRNVGFVKMVTDENRRILGVHIAGPQASILIQSYVYLMNAGAEGLRADYTEAIDRSMIIHPALSEVAGWVTGELKRSEL
jgi:dihydrolipoamide dehydrogenase